MFVIRGAEVFDGESSLGKVDVVVDGETIRSVGGPRPEDVEIVDGNGATLLPGLIDAHTHSSADGLAQALAFGVTTELDMASMPGKMIPLRKRVAESREFADVRSASVALAHPQGHPHQLRKGEHDPEWPTATTPDEAAGFVRDRIAEGADYLKVIVEYGEVMGTSVPGVAPDVVAATVLEGHALGKMVVAHALTLATTEQVVAAGVDGLAHLFVDRAHTREIIDRIAATGMFVVPTLTILASATGQPASSELARDPRVSGKIAAEWLDNLSRTFHTVPPSNFAWALASVAALHAAGVDVLAGTDASHLGAAGIAHGASMHDELRLLTVAGLTPAEALAAATALPARRFGLDDRGRIQAGLRADLLLVDGNPTVNIGDSLSVRAVWRQGTRLSLDAVGN